jgi:hypothetical protein
MKYKPKHLIVLHDENGKYLINKFGNVYGHISDDAWLDHDPVDVLAHFGFTFFHVVVDYPSSVISDGAELEYIIDWINGNISGKRFTKIK